MQTTTDIQFNKVAIIGVGLIGGSLAMILRQKQIATHIIGIGRGIKNLERAKELGVVDEFTQDIKQGVNDADIVIVATPVCSITGIIKDIIPFLKKGTIITDVGSVKQAIVKEVEKFIPEDICFVGGHPIAGTENAGVEAAFLTLFKGKKCILTPTERTDKKALWKIKSIWEAGGSNVILMDAEKHDRILAIISHLPHIVAYSLVNTVADIKDFTENILTYSAGGFKDFTRIASSPPEMWRDICLLNRDAIIDVIKRFQTDLSKLERLINDKDANGIFKEFERAKTVRDNLKTEK